MLKTKTPLGASSRRTRAIVAANDGTGGVRLASGIDVVPTAVLVRNNRETGRITGYSGPESFFQLMRYLLSQAD